jgi:hypothetical protein
VAHKIAPALASFAVPVADLWLLEGNPRQGDVGAVATSIDTFGQRKPVVYQTRKVKRTMRKVVVAGNHTLLAARSLGWDMIAAIDADDLTPLQAQAYAAADNRTAERGTYDDVALAEFLTDIARQDEELFAATGYDGDDLDDLLAKIDAAAGDGGFDLDPLPPPPDPVSLTDRFLVPPLSILDTRQGYWQERRRRWLALGIRSELGRGEDAAAFNMKVDAGNLYRTGDRDVSIRRKDAEKASNLNKVSTLDPDRYKILGGVQAATGTSIFDPVLCEVAYRWFTPYPDASILDPFAGGSVRGAVAAVCGHRYLGIDLNAEQIAANQAQAYVWSNYPDAADPVWIHGDSRNLAALTADEDPFDLVFTCPPYYDLEVYSENPDDLSTADSYDAFLTGYREIIAAAADRLAENRFMVIVTSEVRNKKTRGGPYVGLVPDTIRAMTDAGLAFYNEAILVNQYASVVIRAARQFQTGRKLGRTHQNVLIAYKGDPATITDVFPELGEDRPDLPDDPGEPDTPDTL